MLTRRAAVLNRWSVRRSDQRSETLVRSLGHVVIFGHGGQFLVTISKEPSKVSLRSQTLAAGNPKFGLRFFETLAKNSGTLNCEHTVF